MFGISITLAVALCGVNAFASVSSLPNWAFPGEGVSAAAPASPAAIVSLPGSRATYKHCDHVGSAAPIINAMPVGMIFDSGQA
jgi:hypothetical protein